MSISFNQTNGQNAGSQWGPAAGLKFNKQQMQDYLISQVLFDGKEDVRSSRMTTANKGDGDAKRVEEEHKQKEIEMVNREYELRKKIEQEMAEIKRKEEESKMKLKEAEFEAYKKEMEKYLNFVCEDKEEEDKVKKKTSTSKKKGKIEPTTCLFDVFL